MTKSILIACPTLGLDPNPEKWLSFLITVQNNIRRHGFNQAFLAPYRKDWWTANNEIWNTAFKYCFGYILRIDDDVWGGKDDAFTKLYESNVDVVGAVYPMRQFPYSNCALKIADKNLECNLVNISKHNIQNMTEVSGEGLQEVDLIGFGMTLIKVEPFEEWLKPIYDGVQVCPDDTYFAQRCIYSGIKQHANFDVQLCHREVSPHNRFNLFNADARLMLKSNQIDQTTKQYKELVELFGEDGMKDPTILKSIGVSNDNIAAEQYA